MAEKVLSNVDVENIALPSLQDIFLNKSLYDVMPVSEKDITIMKTLRDGIFRIDAYCIFCKDKSIFGVVRSQGRKPPSSIAMAGNLSRNLSPLDTGYFNSDLNCARCGGNYHYYFRLTQAGLSKVGQYPSIEDIGSADLVKYRGHLKPQDFSELRRASGLFAHSIGIGSFVYLRRIFERLIIEHKDRVEALSDPIANFERMGMDEKIKSLSSVLPPAIVQHSKVYGILSAGIHAMDEETCRRYFPIVKAAILQILDQDIAAKQAEAAAASLEREISEILSEMNGEASHSA